MDIKQGGWSSLSSLGVEFLVRAGDEHFWLQEASWRTDHVANTRSLLRGGTECRRHGGAPGWTVA
jgi:hypothetical protein